MKITHTTTLFIAVITVFDCSKVTWFEAQTICRNINQSISLNKNESDKYYWTGLYQRTSHWIKIIGCYSESTFQNSNPILLSLSSPFQCQEYCLQQSIDEFAVQGSTCVCLSPDFNVTNNQLPSSECTYTCNNSTLLSTECGGNSSFNVFFTDRTNLTTEKHCISLQCGGYPKIVTTYECSEYLPPLCSTNILDNSTINYRNWTESMEICKKNGTYLSGNINLSNLTSACPEHVHTSPYWIGVFRENYFNTDQGQLIEKSAKKFFNKCQRCKFEKGAPECESVGCEEKGNKSEVICSETKEVILPIPDTTYKSTTLQETTEINVSEITTGITTGSSDTPEKNFSDSIEDASDHLFQNTNDGSGISIAVSLVLVLFVMSGCVIAIIIYKRRKNVFQEKDTKSSNVQPAKESERYSDIKTHNHTNYFVLQRSNSTYELTDNSKLEFESPYNEAEEGTYDHLGEKKVRKRPADDIYNHASSAELSDLSDYDVGSRKHLNSEHNTYDRTGAEDDSYGKVKSDLSDYDVANRKHLNKEDCTYDHAGVEGDSYGKCSSSQENETDYSELS